MRVLWKPLPVPTSVDKERPTQPLAIQPTQGGSLCYIIPFYGITIILNNNEVSTPFRSPNVLIPILHEGGIVLTSMQVSTEDTLTQPYGVSGGFTYFVFRLELRETASQDQDFVLTIGPLGLCAVSRFL